MSVCRNVHRQTPGRTFACAAVCVVTALVSATPGFGSVDFARPLITTIDGPVLELGVGEFNGDGRPDLVVATFDRLVPLIAAADGHLTARPAVPVDALTNSVDARLAVFDANGDGTSDVAVAGNRDRSVRLLLGDGAGGLHQAPLPSERLTADSVSAGDVNGDGHADLLIGNALMLGAGNGTFASPTSPLSPETVDSGMVDFDGDGEPDTWTRESQPRSGLRLLHGLGDGTFSPAGFIATRFLVSDVLAADMNADAVPDLVFNNTFSATISVAAGLGGGRFGLSRWPTGSMASATAIGDVNDDGITDIATANFFSDDVTVLEGRGDGTFTPGQQFVSGDNPTAIELVDMNGDGRDDVVAGNLGNSVAVMMSRPLAGGVGTARQRVGCRSPRLVAVDNAIGCVELGMSEAQVRQRFGPPRSKSRTGRYVRYGYPGRLVTIDHTFNFVERISTRRRDDRTEKGLHIGSSVAEVRAKYPDVACVPRRAPTVCLLRGETNVTRFRIRAGRVAAIEVAII